MPDDICAELQKTFDDLIRNKLGDDVLDMYQRGSAEQRMGIADDLLAETDLKIRQAKLMALAWDRLSKYIKDAPKKAQALIDLISGQGARRAGVHSLENHFYGIFAQHVSKLADAVEKYRVRKLGFDHSLEAQENLVKELFQAGSTADKDAAAFAKIFSETFEELRIRFNKAGGGIKKLTDYNMPQYHDAVKYRRFIAKSKNIEAAFDEWLSDMDGWLVRKEGLENLSMKQYRVTMKGIFKHLHSDGVIKAPAKSYNPFKRGRIGKRHLHHRLLHFKDGDAWIAYAKKYGATDYYNAMMGHIEIMSKEIAAMEIFGPSSDMMVKRVRILAQQQVAEQGKGKGQITGKLMQDSYDLFLGGVHSPNTRMADWMQGTRNFVTGLKIGKASITALSDVGYFGITAKMWDMPIIKTYAKALNNLTINNQEGRMLATRILGLVDYSLDRARSARRISEVVGGGASARFADFIVRSSGLNFWTNTLEQTFGLELAANLADLTKFQFKNLPRGIRKNLNGYAITADDWNLIRTKPVLVKNGVRYLDPVNFGDDTLTSKIVGMIREEIDFAVPKPNTKSRAVLYGATRPGTFSGEMRRFMGQFKSFPVSVVLTHMMRAANMPTYKGRMAYAGSLILGTTILGTLSYQTKQLIAGKTMMDWNNEKLWMTGFVQGGGTGILGDLFFMDHKRMGSLAEFFLGPTANVGETLLRLWAGNIQDSLNLDREVEPTWGRAGAETLREAIPTLLWTKLLLDRLVADQVGKMIDPKWHRRQISVRRRLRKRGQEQWWKPGELAPR